MRHLHRTKIIAVCLPLLCGSLVYAQKATKPTTPVVDNTAQETKKIKEDLDAAKAEVTRLNDELSKLKLQMEEDKKLRGQENAANQAASDALIQQLNTLQSSLEKATEAMLALNRGSQQSTRLALAAQGITTYKRHCSTCHGEDGKGKGASADFLDQIPRDLTRGTYKFRTTSTGSLPTDADLARTISVGIPGTSMPGWGKDLSDEEILQVVAVIENFSSRFAEEDPGETIAVPKSPENLKDLTETGRALYLGLGCNQCHGDKGKGDGPSKALKDETGQKILATNFTRGIFKSGSTNEDLYRTISTGLDGSPMPSYYDAILLSRGELEQLAAKLPAKEAESLRAYAKTQPEEAPAADSPQAEQRRWALVAYLRSVVKKRTFFDWLFRDSRRYDTIPK
jgi:mono/diheme cytochrome c family protein